ncbi:MAG: hypothetical protein NTX75_11715 [Proteobacteria bacterium]|nr:hypothetical protein [Pseudomonadota bacterium]
MDYLVIEEKNGRFEIFAEIKQLGKDLLVIVYGGAAHIGAIGMAQPRASLRDPEKASATSSTYTYIGHKEDAVVKTMSEEIAKRLNKKVVVVAGIHWDELSMEEIEIIMEACRTITEKVITEVQKW